MKKFFVLILAVTIFIGMVGCGKYSADFENANDKSQPTEKKSQDTAEINNETDKKDKISKQIQLIADNIDLWKIDDEIENGAYAVCDINNNGRLEIISSTCQGTGMYSQNNIWEVNENMDGLVKCSQTIKEGDSQADIMSANIIPAYYDSQKNVYYLIFDDLTKSSMAEYYENKRSWSLQNNQVIENYLAYKSTIYTDSDNTDITCKDAEDNIISEEEYNNIADKIYSNLKKMSMKISWINSSDMDKDKIYNQLEDSYNNFSIK